MNDVTKIQHIYDELAEALKDLGVKKSNMFGMPMLKLGKRPIGGLHEDGIMFKLPVDSDEMKYALSLQGSHIFTPSMNGRTATMKQWVIVPIAHRSHFIDFATRSIRFVESDE